jgi:hypothetical protein
VRELAAIDQYIGQYCRLIKLIFIRLGNSAKIFNCDMRCIHSPEIFGYTGSSITDYPRCSLQFQAQVPYVSGSDTDSMLRLMR